MHGTDLSSSPVVAGLSNQNRYMPLLYAKFHTWKFGRLSGSCVKSEWYPDAEYTFGKHNVLIHTDELSNHVALPPEGSALILVCAYNLKGKPYACWTIAYTSIPGYVPADLEPDPVLPNEWDLGNKIQLWADRRWAECQLLDPDAPAAAGTGARVWQAGDVVGSDDKIDQTGVPL